MQEQPTTNKKSSNSNQAIHGSSGILTTSNTTTSGENASQGAVNINPENALDKWNRLEASGGLDSLSDDDYYNLANAANALDSSSSPISSFYRFNRVANITNQYAASLAADISHKQYNVDMMKLRVANNQAWVNQNTNELGGITQGFDLEAMIGRNTDWTDMSYDLTPGPWRDGYVFGASTLSKPSALTQELAQLSFFSGAYGTTDSMLKGLASTKYGNYGIGLMQSKGWSLADGTPSLSSLFDGGYNRISNTSIYGFGNPSSYFAISKVDDLFVNSGSFAEFINSPAVKTTGETISWLGPFSSGLQALDYNFAQNDWKGHSWEEHGIDNLSNYTKFGVDSLITGSAYFVGAIPAAIYGVTDFSLQYFDYSYTPKYHPTESGIPKKSWTGLGYLYFESQQNILENNQRVNSNWSLMNLGKI